MWTSKVGEDKYYYFLELCAVYFDKNLTRNLAPPFSTLKMETSDFSNLKVSQRW
jgi:hypothetical protein